MIKLPLFPICILSLLTLASVAFGKSNENERQRLIVLTDIGADPDDEQSLVRLLLYSNQIDIEGIVATTSCWQRTTVRPYYIQSILDAYEKVQPNLTLHEQGYPEADALRSVVRNGIPTYGMAGVGDGKDSEGSDWIIERLEDDDPRPLWISIWGGANVLAQSLHKMREMRSPEELDRLVSKLRVYTISDQDDSGAWMRREFPDLFYIVSAGDDYGNATWNAINRFVDGIDNTTISNPWIAGNIQQDHGPLGATYPDVAWGMEGDTPAYLNLIPNGLSDPEHPNWGGWGGRYEMAIPDFELMKDGGSIVVPERETRAFWTDTSDTFRPYESGEYGRTIKASEKVHSGFLLTLWRWREDFQNDFAARMDWCTKSFEEANHPPVPHLQHAKTLTVEAGQGVELNAYGSMDPDGDSLSYLWFHYPEAGSYKATIGANSADNADRFYFTAPQVDKTETAHFILRLTDKGTPNLTRYQRIIVTIVP